MNTLEEQAKVIHKRYDAGVPDNIQIQKRTFNHVPNFYTSELTISKDLKESTIKDIANHFNISLLDAYKRYVPVFIAKRLNTVLIKHDAIGADENGNLYLVVNKNTQADINRFMNMYCYQFEHMKEYALNSDAVILYYRLET